MALIDAAYDAAVNPERWWDFCHLASAALAGAPVCLHVHDREGGAVRGGYHAGHEDEAFGRYLEHFSALDPVIAARDTIAPGHPVRVSAVVDPERYHGSAFYREWLAPQGGASDGAVMVLPMGPERDLVFRTYFAPRDAEDGGAMARFAAIASFLYGALRVRMGAGGQRARSLGLDVLLESTRTGLFILDAACRPIEMHGPTNVLMDKGMLHVDAAGVLCFRDEAVAELLAQAQAASRAGERFTSTLTLTIDEEGTVVVLTVVAVTQGSDHAASAPWEEKITAALAVSTVSRSLSVAVTSKRYGLSRAEMEVLNGLIAGKSAKRLADERGTSVHTVRNQVASLLSKTKTSSQKELIALFTRSFPG